MTWTLVQEGRDPFPKSLSAAGLNSKSQVVAGAEKLESLEALGQARIEILEAEPYTLHPLPYTRHPTPYTLHPQPSTLNPQPSTLNPQPSILYSKAQTLKPRP